MTRPARPRGHLFVVQADMTRLATDAYVIPCDGTPELTRSWQGLVAPSDEPASHADWFRPKDVRLVDGVAVVDPAAVPADSRPEEIGKTAGGGPVARGGCGLVPRASVLRSCAR